MGKQLQKRFVIITLSIFVLILSVMGVVINVSNYSSLIARADRTASIILNNGGVFPTQTSGYEEGYSSRYFSIGVYANGNKYIVSVDNMPNVTRDDAFDYTDSVLAKNTESGTILNYWFKVGSNEIGQVVVFVDITPTLESLYSFIRATIIIGLIVSVALLVALIFISKKVVAPLVASDENQKRFIADLTHEIKTPIAIIKANMEVLELSSGETRWTKSTLSQTDRMDEMLKRLTLLTVVDNGKKIDTTDKADLSTIVTECVAEFSQSASKTDKVIKSEIACGLQVHGSGASLRSLVDVIFDNAVKCGQASSPISVKLYESKNKAILECSNYTDYDYTPNYSKWFGRFYKEDSSRNSDSKSYGIGLSMAKAIAESYGGSISAIEEKANKVKIRVELILK